MRTARDFSNANYRLVSFKSHADGGLLVILDR